jgi:hypothetical protein
MMVEPLRDDHVRGEWPVSIKVPPTAVQRRELTQDTAANESLASLLGLGVSAHTDPFQEAIVSSARTVRFGIGCAFGEVVEYGRKADVEHLLPNPAEELGHEEAADTSEAFVLEREEGVVASRFDLVGHDGGLFVFLASPRVPQETLLVYFDDLTVDLASPAWDRLSDELELAPDDGGEPDRSPALSSDRPAGHQLRVGDSAPDHVRWVWVATNYSNLDHRDSLLDS